MTKLNKYWFFALPGTLLVSSYPIYMGIKVIYEMTTAGTLTKENFPKYIIPYTPIAIAVLFAVVFMPLFIRIAKKFAVLASSVLSLGVFFVAELLFESKIIVTETVQTTLESWQMTMCYISPDRFATRTWTAVDVLMGEYSPMFKLHFYLISVILIVAIIGCIYGFATGKKEKYKALTAQSIATALFLGLCILACFTAFFRDGEITVSPLSAFLMALFFIIMGMTAGVYTGSFLIGKKKKVSVLIPSLTASFITLLMYIGEMFLLSGHLYRLGTGILFEPIPVIILSVMDIFIVALSGIFTAIICNLINKQTPVCTDNRESTSH